MKTARFATFIALQLFGASLARAAFPIEDLRWRLTDELGGEFSFQTAADGKLACTQGCERGNWKVSAETIELRLENGSDRFVLTGGFTAQQDGLTGAYFNPYAGRRLNWSARSLESDLAMAVLTGNFEAVRALVDTGANGATPSLALYLAAETGRDELVARIHERWHPSIYRRVLRNRSPLEIAFEKGNRRTVQAMLESESDWQGLLLFGIRMRDTALVRQALAGRPDVNAVIPTVYWNFFSSGAAPDGSTAVHVAARIDNPDVLKAIAAVPGLAVNATTFRPEGALTPLMLALQAGQLFNLQILLNHPDADPNVRNADGQTVLHLAVIANNEEAVRLILNHDNLLPDVRDNAGLTALDLATRGTPNPRIVRMLMNAQNGDPS